MRRKYYSDEELLQLLRDFSNEYGITPSARKFDADPNYPNVSTYINHFGKWSRALKLVGL